MTQSEFNSKFQSLKQMEAKLRQPVRIKTIGDYTRLLQRYREYVILFQALGTAIAKKHYPYHWKQITMDDMVMSLYPNIEDDKQEVVFQNKTYLSNFVNEDLENTLTSYEELQQLYRCRDFLLIKSDFSTPVSLSESTFKQFPRSVWSPHDFINIDDVIEELASIRQSKLTRLTAEL